MSQSHMMPEQNPADTTGVWEEPHEPTRQVDGNEMFTKATTTQASNMGNDQRPFVGWTLVVFIIAMFLIVDLVLVLVNFVIFVRPHAEDGGAIVGGYTFKAIYMSFVVIGWVVFYGFSSMCFVWSVRPMVNKSKKVNQFVVGVLACHFTFLWPVFVLDYLVWSTSGLTFYIQTVSVGVNVACWSMASLILWVVWCVCVSQSLDQRWGPCPVDPDAILPRQKQTASRMGTPFHLDTRECSSTKPFTCITRALPLETISGSGRAIAFEQGLLCADDCAPWIQKAETQGVPLQTVLIGAFGFGQSDADKIVDACEESRALFG